MIKRIRRNDKGAIAAFLAITTSFVLLLSGALAVDLGNAWARKRDVQKQVDVAALAAAHMLPVTTVSQRAAIAQAVLDSMKQTDNSVGGQTLSTLTGQKLVDDGLVTFQNQDATDNWVTCPAGAMCTQMTVVSPASKVQFGLAGVIGKGSVDVARTATVRVSTELPPGQDVMPFWLPNGCVYGPAEPDTTQGGPSSGPSPSSPTTTATTTATATATTTATTVGTPAGNFTIGTQNYQISSATTMISYTIDTTGTGQKIKAGVVRFVSPDGNTTVDAAVSDTQKGNSNYQLVTGDFVVPAQVAATSGTWKVYAYLAVGNGNGTVQQYSSNSLTVTVLGAGPTTSSAPTSSAPTSGATSTTTATATPSGIPVGCTGQDRGNFGQLASPRTGYNLQGAFPVNIALGLDHQVVPYTFNPAQPVVTDCADIPANMATGDFYKQNDDQSRKTAPFNNCILADTGNDGPKMLDGLVTGTNGYPGRLDVANGHTNCPKDPSRSDSTFDGVTINNEVLSCYLLGTATLADLASDHANDLMLDGSITNSPRFVWLPVVYANDRTVKDYQPLKMFVPGFITDENSTTGATASNGLTLNGNGNSLSKFTVFTFNPAALPEQERAPIIDYDPTKGISVYNLVG